MSASTDEDERRKRSLEVGKDMLEKYKMDRLNKPENEPSDEESLHNDKSTDFRGSSTNEGLSSRDITRSSISMSEGEGDGDLEGMAGRVAELEQLLQGKEAIVEALSTEIDFLRAEAPSPNSSQSQSSSVQGREIISLYRTRFQEFEIAINQRDNLIEDLTSSLEQALSSRDALLAELNRLNAMQLPSPDVLAKNVQEKVAKMEATVAEQQLMIHKLNEQLGKAQEHVQTLELEKETHTAEISDYKMQIHNLNEQIRLGTAEKDLNSAESLEHQKQYEARIDKIKQNMQHILEKFTLETNANAARHQQELKDLSSKHESEITNIQIKYEECLKVIKDENKMLADRLNKLADLESRHAKELSVFQTQMEHYKRTIKTLKSELVNRTESQKTAEAQISVCKRETEDVKVQAENSLRMLELNHQKEKEMLNEQIKLHKIQLEEVTAKHLAAAALLESKESLEHSLQQALTNAASLKDENNVLRFKLDDLSSRYSAARSLIENNQQHERSMSSRILDLEKSLSRLSGINVSVLSELNDTTYQTIDEFAIQYQSTRQKLEEKQELEKLLVEKIRGLEDDVAKAKDELERANLTKKSYEKQLKDMKNLCDKLRSEIYALNEKCQATHISTEESKSSEQDMREIIADFVKKIENSRQEVEALKCTVEKKDAEISDYVKLVQDLEKKTQRAENECEQLKSGLAAAWAQCAEVEERLNQTLAMNETRADLSLPVAQYNDSVCKCLKSNVVSSNVTLDNTDSSKPEDANESREENVKEKTSSTMGPLVSTKYEKMLKEMEHLLGKQPNFDMVLEKLYDNFVSCEELTVERNQLLSENETLKAAIQDVETLKELVEQLKADKLELEQQVEKSIERHNAELNASKVDAAMEIKKIQSFLTGVKKDSRGKLEINSELEIFHPREIEELRAFFEQKYLEMEKQSIGEILGEQSRKVLDDDNRVERLSRSPYCIGAGDGVVLALENDEFAAAAYQARKKSFLGELELRRVEGADGNMTADKRLEEQERMYEIYRKDFHDRGHRVPAKTIHQHCQTEWDVDALENCELLQLRAAYRRQLEEQVAQARLDIVHALQEQIQSFLSLEEGGEDSWPPELIQLRDKLTNNAKEEMQVLKDSHSAELARLKEEYSSNIAKALESHEEEIKKLNYFANFAHANSGEPQELSIVKERDNLQKVCIVLKNLIEELTKYFMVCEEEINNTIITEILKGQGLDNMYSAEKDVGRAEKASPQVDNKVIDADNSILNLTEQKMKRVHFAPQVNELVSIINSDSVALQSIVEEDESIIDKLRKQLNACVHRLRSESANILGVPLSASEEKSVPLSNEMVWMNQISDDFKMKMNQTESLIASYQEECEQQKIKIMDLERKLASANNKKEIITEGYGEHDDIADYDITLQDFSQLQEKARRILSNGGADSAYMLEVIEELCTQSDKVMDDAKREKEDLQQQILAADKQLRATRRFLEEQASEREAERDESAKQIRCLQEQLKEREREKERDLRISSEVEAMESRMREMSSLVSDTEAKKSEKECELKAAIEKICVLRDIIGHLEQQLQVKSKSEETLQLQIVQLDAIIAEQTKNQEELAHELECVKMSHEDKQMADHIAVLQEELRKHKISSEHFSENSPVLKQMRSEIREMQSLLDKRISELESLHACSSTLSISQPSEDVSIREQIEAARCVTPDDPNAPPVLPLDQLLKLKQKMLKQVRAEEVAFKKIKDLEMHLSALKDQNEDLLTEHEILQQRASEQLFQMEAMRGRLEQHKQSAPFAQRQATSRLELQLHEANTKLQSLERCVADKDLEIRDMKSQLDRTIQLLQEKESEIANLAQTNCDTIQKLKDHLKVVEDENRTLHSKVGIQERAQLELPQLIDSMLADKNEEIDHLKEQLSKKEKQLDLYSSLPLHDADFREFGKQSEPKNSARTLSDVLSIHSECEELPEAVRAAPNSSQILPHSVSGLRVPVVSMLSENVTDVSAVPQIDPSKTMEQISPLDLGSHSDNGASPSLRHSRLFIGIEQGQCDFSQEAASMSAGDQNRFNLTCVNNSSDIEAKDINEFLQMHNEKIRRLECQLDELKKELDSKAVALEKRERELSILEGKYKELEIELKETVETLTNERNFYKNLHELSQVSENKIKKDLEEVENILKLKTEALEQYENKMQMNEKIITELNAENVTLRGNVKDGKRDEHIKKYATLLQEKVNELDLLNGALLEKDVMIETLQTRNLEIENENKQLYEYRSKYQACKQELAENQTEVKRLTEGLNSRDQVITKLEGMARRSSLTGASSPADEKDQEIHHLQEYIKEKDRVIRQMRDDSKSLHRALETIQNKMKESGNVVELRKKLKEERKVNADMKNAIESLKKERKYLKEACAQRSQDETDIEDMVQRELNLSARLDKQLLNIIESDTEEQAVQKSAKASTSAADKLQQAEKSIEELKKQKDQLEVENSVLKCQIAEYEDRIFQLQFELTEESKKVAKLTKELAAEQSAIQWHKEQAEKEQKTQLLERNQDIERIEAKLKLSLENEERIRNELALLRQEYKNSEAQFSAMVEKLQSEKMDSAPKLSDVIEAEKKKYISLMEQYEKEQRKNVELQNTLIELQAEKKSIATRHELALEEKEEIMSTLELTNGIKNHLETSLKRTKEELKEREEECGWLQQKIKAMTSAKSKRQGQRSSEQSELMGLRRQINNARDVMADLEADMEQSKRQLENAAERELTLTRALDAAKAREAELGEELRVAKVEGKELKDTIAQLQRDLTASFKRELDVMKGSGDAHANDDARLSDELMKVRTEKDRLAVYVKSLESQVKQNRAAQSAYTPGGNTVEKIQHFYGKYLRSDSRRKALAYQKHYLLCVLKGYMVSEENTLCILAQLTQAQRSCTRITHNRKNPKTRFKSIIFVLISIRRMKWLIVRWRTGKCVGADTLLGSVDNAYNIVRKSSSNHSPPVKDTANSSRGLNGSALEHYCHRLKNIQQTLGFAMMESSASHTVTE